MSLQSQVDLLVHSVVGMYWGPDKRPILGAQRKTFGMLGAQRKTVGNLKPYLHLPTTAAFFSGSLNFLYVGLCRKNPKE